MIELAPNHFGQISYSLHDLAWFSLRMIALDSSAYAHMKYAITSIHFANKIGSKDHSI